MPFLVPTPFAERTAMANRMREKYADRVPVILRSKHISDSELPDITKQTFLVPVRMLVGEFENTVNKLIRDENKHIVQCSRVFLIVGGIALVGTENMKDIYDLRKNEDGFLYLTYDSGPEEDLAKLTMKAMHKDRSFQDGYIVADGEEIPVHRAVIAAASPVMKQMLQSNFREGEQARITMSDTTAATAHAFVDFAYGESLPANADVLQLFELALFYDVGTLGQICLNMLTKSTDTKALAVGMSTLKRLSEDPRAASAHKRLRAVWREHYQKSDSKEQEAMLDELGI